MKSFEKFKNKKTALKNIIGGAPNYEKTYGYNHETGEEESDLAGRCFGAHPSNGTYTDYYAKRSYVAAG
ncbi:hypothetical protein [Tenacibaculum agarivorans]|uniref:hypothetical protein n=1 Tax=Tenacibaculum agarivorans TaxID=1908389 RepID=UPI00094B7B8B|nr:hypothetical protein [Tenacibaculum agarivorans]